MKLDIAVDDEDGGVPLNRTAVALVNPEPWIVTCAPAAPLVGLKDEMAGGAITVKLATLVAVPAAFVTLTGPEVVIGTVARTVVSLSIVNKAEAPLNRTAVAKAKLVPWIVTCVPTDPTLGLKEVRVGSAITVKLVALEPVPDGVVTLTDPDVAPAGTVARIWDELSIV